MNGILKKVLDNYTGVLGEWKSRCMRKRTWRLSRGEPAVE